jgi:hypothetical protein
MTKFGMNLDMAKCQWLGRVLTSLGFKNSSGKLQPDPAKVDAILQLRRPENLAELRAFNGLLSFYSRFFPNFAGHFAPLQEPVLEGLQAFHKKNPRDRPQKKDNDRALPWNTTTTVSKVIAEGHSDSLQPLNQIPGLEDEFLSEQPLPKNKSKRQKRFLEKIPVDWTEPMVEAQSGQY